MSENQSASTLATNSLRVESYPWLAAPLGGENPQPVFRARSSDMPVAAHESLPPEIAATIGKGCGRRVLPYRMQDRYGRQRQVRDFLSIVLENENLKATFLPELGGRLISLFHKPTQRELLFKNPVFQPANLALRDAWFAGGIEWNIGQFGHAFHTCSPVFAAAIPGLNGKRALRLYDFERCKGLLWQIDFHLPPGAEFLFAITRVVNPRDDETAMYWWTNVAVPESPDVRVLAPADTSIYVVYDDAGLCYPTSNTTSPNESRSATGSPGARCAPCPTAYAQPTHPWLMGAPNPRHITCCGPENNKAKKPIATYTTPRYSSPNRSLAPHAHQPRKAIS